MPGDEVTIENPSRHGGQTALPARHVARPSWSRTGSYGFRSASDRGGDIAGLLDSTGDYPAVVGDGNRNGNGNGGAVAPAKRGPTWVEGDRSQPLSEARDQLRGRLAAGALWLALVLALLLVCSLLAGDRDPVVVLGTAWVVGALAIVHFWLANDRD